MDNTSDHLPDLFHIGLQRAGSTYLYNLLKAHPDVAVSNRQETNFYYKKFRFGPTWYTGLYGHEKYRIDTSPVYFRMGRQVAPRIKATLHDRQPRFLLILRNPIDYIYSHFEMNLRMGYFRSQKSPYPAGTSSLIELGKSDPGYLERGLFAAMLERHWLTHFDLEQFKFVFFEEFVSDTDQVMEGILDFFSIPRRRLTAAASSKNRLFKYPSLYKIRDIIVELPKLKSLLKHSRLINHVYARYLTTQLPPLTGDDRLWLRDFFTDDVKRLKAITGRLPPQWTELE